MSRKNLLSSLTEKKLTAVNHTNLAETSLSNHIEKNRTRGAFGAISRSIDELAEKANAAKEIEARLLTGATVVDLDPELIDVSFVTDRIGDNREAFEDLLAAIRDHGQHSPILVRPHRSAPGRYMVVFGHRRLRAAKALAREVRAVIRDISDRDHVIAQGLENSARADLSFIEKATFANGLEQNGYDRDVIIKALSVDKTVVSKMLSVTKDIPTSIIQAIGPAKQSGRDRWYSLALVCRNEFALNRAGEFTQSPEFETADSDGRLELLTRHLQRPRPQKIISAPNVGSWAPSDRSLVVRVKRANKDVTISVREKDGNRFGTWISENLEGLYEAFRKSQKENETAKEKGPRA